MTAGAAYPVRLWQPDYWKGPGGLAAIPLLLIAILPLLALTLPENLLPSLFRFGYTPDELALLLILLGGASIGARLGFPVWSYSWVVTDIRAGEDFLRSLVSSAIFHFELGSSLLGWILLTVALTGIALTVLFAVSRTHRGVVHDFYMVALYLVILRVFVFERSDYLSQLEVWAANSYNILVSATALGVILTAVRNFITLGPELQRKFVGMLLALAIIYPVLTPWVHAVLIANPGILAAAGLIGAQFLATWLQIGVVLLLTWGSIKGYAWLKRHGTDNPTDIGVPHGS